MNNSRKTFALKSRRKKTNFIGIIDKLLFRTEEKKNNKSNEEGIYDVISSIIIIKY